MCMLLVCSGNYAYRVGIKAGGTGPAGPAAAGPILLPNHTHLIIELIDYKMNCKYYSLLHVHVD